MEHHLLSIVVYHAPQPLSHELDFTVQPLFKTRILQYNVMTTSRAFVENTAVESQSLTDILTDRKFVRTHVPAGQTTLNRWQSSNLDCYVVKTSQG
jgi:hypothetical protein